MKEVLRFSPLSSSVNGVDLRPRSGSCSASNGVDGQVPSSSCSPALNHVLNGDAEENSSPVHHPSDSDTESKTGRFSTAEEMSGNQRVRTLYWTYFCSALEFMSKTSPFSISAAVSQELSSNIGPRVWRVPQWLLKILSSLSSDLQINRVFSSHKWCISPV